jgi:hypothetical protein
LCGSRLRRGELEHLSIEVDVHPERFEEIEAEQATSAGAHMLKRPEIERADGEIGGRCGSNPQGIDTQQTKRSAKPDSSSDSHRPSSHGKIQLPRERVIQAGERSTCVQNQVDGPSAIDERGNEDRGAAWRQVKLDFTRGAVGRNGNSRWQPRSVARCEWDGKHRACTSEQHQPAQRQAAALQAPGTGFMTNMNDLLLSIGAWRKSCAGAARIGDTYGNYMS